MSQNKNTILCQRMLLIVAFRGQLPSAGPSQKVALKAETAPGLCWKREPSASSRGRLESTPTLSFVLGHQFEKTGGSIPVCLGGPESLPTCLFLWLNEHRDSPPRFMFYFFWDWQMGAVDLCNKHLRGPTMCYQVSGVQRQKKQSLLLSQARSWSGRAGTRRENQVGTRSWAQAELGAAASSCRHRALEMLSTFQGGQPLAPAPRTPPVGHVGVLVVHTHRYC